MTPWRVALWSLGACVVALAVWIGIVQWQNLHSPRAQLAKAALPAKPWFQASPYAPPVRPQRVTANPACPEPQVTGDGEAPLQTAVPDGIAKFNVTHGRLDALAGFSVDARVLSRRDYSGDRPALFSPIDLALGWGPMTDGTTLAQLNVRQSNRWYRYGWVGNPPLDPGAIIRNSANMHMIPSNAAIENALRAVQRDDRVRIDGWLVEAHDGGGWNWRSSMTRDDSGAGACEVVYVCRITRY
ncbi:hypothetical protein [Solilutibacter silvestris]|uniref:Uncharacterized protein n=1 Tax=Solilutibacter silvestris TaxID=1645665 RepID=A0A2K1PXK8_9GAMM|nr:hypothetical protein [Lysobacter silvestris]PNS07523.1 hypothetical protein Lysil_1699 [Lysobacter silvestris]